MFHRRDTENTEDAQRVAFLCAISVSSVSLRRILLARSINLESCSSSLEN